MIEGQLAHLLAAPVLVPLVAAASMMGIDERRRATKSAINLASTFTCLAIAVLLLWWSDASPSPGVLGVYLPGNWPVPFGIVLVVDRLSALMLLLASCTALAALLYSLARWHRGGVHFHPLLQLQLAGLNGAFLTGDLFNLFVFFEVLLAASYGLLLHGGGVARVRTGLHYIAVNLLASLLFLMGAALLYGVTGTLNMADIAQKLPHVPEGDRGLLHAAASMLAVAFLAKAALWPLNFWLPPAYAAASAPAAAMFAVLTKVGVYAVLRLWTLCFPPDAGASALFGADVLVWGGLVTLALAAVGMLASQPLGRIAGYSIIASSGMVIAACGFDVPSLTAGAMYYLASSTLATAALFLVVELVDRARQTELDLPETDDEDDHLPDFLDGEPPQDVNLDDQEVALTGRAIPAAIAFLGLAFVVCALVVSGLPPMSGFVGKVAMLSALADARLLTGGAAHGWALFAMIIVSGLLAAMAFVRIGLRHFWAPINRAVPRLRVVEFAPVALLLGGCLTLVVAADPALRYLRATADALHEPARYVNAVLAARPVAGPNGSPSADAPGPARAGVALEPSR